MLQFVKDRIKLVLTCFIYNIKTFFKYDFVISSLTSHFSQTYIINILRSIGFEPMTCGLEGRCSIQAELRTLLFYLIFNIFHVSRFNQYLWCKRVSQSSSKWICVYQRLPKYNSRGLDLNQRRSDHESDKLPDCFTPH